MNLHAALSSLIGAVASLLVGCSGQSDLQAGAAAIEKQLAWVEEAKPDAMLDADTRAGRQRFLSVCSYSCVVLEVGSITAKRCFPSVHVQAIEGTTDTILSERHAALVRRAAEVAAEYNRLAARALAHQGRTVCPEGANWDAAFRDLHALARKTNPNLAEADFTLLAIEPKFLLVLPSHLLSAGFEASACATLRKHNLPSAARIAVVGREGSLQLKANVLCGAASAA